MTTTGRFLIISGALKPVLNSHISSVPGFGWKFSIEVEYYCLLPRLEGDGM